MASRLCCCGFHSGYYRLGSRWTWTTACSNLLRIWIGKNYVIFFSIQIIVSLWCILLFCLLHDCEILHRNEVFSDRIEIEKTEVLNLTLGCGKIIILAPVVCGSQSQDRVTKIVVIKMEHNAPFSFPKWQKQMQKKVIFNASSASSGSALQATQTSHPDIFHQWVGIPSKLSRVSNEKVDPWQQL